jgi:hypothetical protein
MSDVLTTALSFFGRGIDALSRDPLPAAEYRVSVVSPPVEAVYKRDGYFAFQNLRPSPSAYTFQMTSLRYQTKAFQKALPTASPVELSMPGEDELFLVIKSVTVATKKIGFDKIPFLPRIPKDARVLGEAGFSTTLKSELGGVDADVATLNDVTGLSAGMLLRIVRSRSLVAKPGPYYPFPQGMTVVALTIVEDAPGEEPLADARARITQVNGVSPASTVVDGVALHHVTLPAPPNPTLILGLQEDLSAFSDGRGRAVFYYPGIWSLSSLEVELTHPGHVTKTAVVTLTPGQRTSATLKLMPA